MNFLTSLFGGNNNMILTVILSLGVVIILIMLAVWGLKMMFNASGSVARGRQKRLHVTEVTPLDQKRQLVLIRRDNVEHLVLIGGTQDLLIETGIEAPSASASRPQRKTSTTTDSAATRFNKAKQNPQKPTPPKEAAPQVKAIPIVTGVALQPAPAPEIEPETNIPPVNAGNPLEELGRPLKERKSSSLRHTGLLRPVSHMEPAVFPTSIENSAVNSSDSDKHEPLIDTPNSVEQHNRADENHDAEENDGGNDKQNAKRSEDTFG